MVDGVLKLLSLIFVCFDALQHMLYNTKATIFQACWDNLLSSWVEPVLSRGYLSAWIKCLVQGHKTVTPRSVSLELAILRSPELSHWAQSQSAVKLRSTLNYL